MKQIKITVFALVTALLLSGLAGCGTGGAAQTAQPSVTPVQTAEKTKVNIAVLAGPTGIGAAKLMKNSDEGTSANDYTFTVASSPDEIKGKIVSGELDLAAVPTNLAAALYNKTNGAVQIAAVNTLGVLYILENGDTVHSMADLKGKTIYTTGQGSNPEYVLNYLLRQNGLEPGTDVTVEYKTSEEVTAMAASGQAKLVMLPVPASTSVLMKNSSVRVALNLTKEWNKLAQDSDSVLTQGCIVVQKKFAEEHPDAVSAFLQEYQASIDYVVNNLDDAAQLVADYGITGSAAVAKAAIPDCNLVCITGTDMKPALTAYYQVLFDADPASVGGKLPDDGFYYTK